MKRAMCAAAVTICGHASAEILTDQCGSPFVSGGLGGPVLQSFMPAENNIIRVDVEIIGTSALQTDVTITVYSEYSGGGVAGLSGELASGTDVDIPPGTTASVTFDAAAILVPDQTYYLLFELSDNLVVGTGRSTPSPYERGEILLGGGNFSGGDTAFKTYFDSSIPAPASAAAFFAIAAFAGRRRHA